MTATAFTHRQRVRFIAARPLLNGKVGNLVGLIDFFNTDGTVDVRVCTAGIYCGSIINAPVEQVQAA